VTHSSAILLRLPAPAPSSPAARRLATPTPALAAPSAVPSLAPSLPPRPSYWRAPPSLYTQEERTRRSIVALYVCLIFAVLVIVPIMVVVRKRNAARRNNRRNNNNNNDREGQPQGAPAEPSAAANDAAAVAAAAAAADLESREARRKLREQRKAWISQLLTQVQMVRSLHPFLGAVLRRPPSPSISRLVVVSFDRAPLPFLASQVLTPDHIVPSPAAAAAATAAAAADRVPPKPATSNENDTNSKKEDDAEGSGDGEPSAAAAAVGPSSPAAFLEEVDLDDHHHDAMIRVPVPGIRQYGSGSKARKEGKPAAAAAAAAAVANEGGENPEEQSSSPAPRWRNASGTCAICLGHYVAGDAVAWSSNALCEHCFHLDCIEAWLHKQRTFAVGALCPVCRRDFLVDPCFADNDDSSSFVAVTPEGGADPSPSPSPAPAPGPAPAPPEPPSPPPPGANP
jgi:Ring finger domain